jgi:hypothetical protein
VDPDSDPDPQHWYKRKNHKTVEVWAFQNFFILGLEAVLGMRDVYPGSQIPDPDFYPSRIPDPRSKNSNKREG